MKLTILSIDSSAAPSPSLKGLVAPSSVAVAVPSLPTDDSVTIAKAVNFHPFLKVFIFGGDKKQYVLTQSKYVCILSSYPNSRQFAA